MKLMTQKLAALALLTGTLNLTTPARAADEKTSPQPAPGANAAGLRERFQQAIEQLNLTEAQKEKVKPIMQSLMEKIRAVREDGTLSAEQRMEKMKAIREEFTPRLKEVLTPEQVEKLQGLRGERIGRVQEALKDLNLTDEQKEKLRPIFQEEMQKMREMRADTNLTPQQKMEKLKAMRDEVAPKVKEVLTPEQYEKWQKHVDEARGQIERRVQQEKR